jgi:hypothetical protein
MMSIGKARIGSVSMARPGKAKLSLFTVGIWASMFSIFVASPVLQVNDSRYSMLTAESLIQNHSPDLDYYSIPAFESDRVNHGYPLGRANGRLLYGFAHGSAFLSVPFVALMNWFGVSPATPSLEFNLQGELIIQKFEAAVVSASAVSVFFLTSTLALDLTWSSLIAVGAGLGTQVWSTASRGMWQHTWEIMLGSLVVYLLMAAELRAARMRPVLLASLLSWMFFVRPTGGVAVVCTSVYVYTRWRSELLRFAMAGAAWFAAFVAYSLRVFGGLVPRYYYSLGLPFPWGVPISPHPMTALYGTLFSPSRGIFIFCPVFAWLLFVTFRYWNLIRPRALVITALFVWTGIWLAVINHGDWWGGACYGPRFLSDAIPWLVLIAIATVNAIPPPRRTIRDPLIATCAFLVIIGIGMNAIGALYPQTMAWNFRGPSPDIMLDWSYPQFLAGWDARGPK